MGDASGSAQAPWSAGARMRRISRSNALFRGAGAWRRGGDWVAWPVSRGSIAVFVLDGGWPRVPVTPAEHAHQSVESWAYPGDLAPLPGSLGRRAQGAEGAANSGRCDSSL